MSMAQLETVNRSLDKVIKNPSLGREQMQPKNVAIAAILSQDTKASAPIEDAPTISEPNTTSSLSDTSTV